jgi:hypothetical protein
MRNAPILCLPIGRQRRRAPMLDAILLLGAAGFFAIAILYAAACEKM